MSTFDDIPPVPKVEQSEEDDFDESSGEEDIGNLAPDVPQVQKRKGGRKPIYATSEERKQRNRQAQAAFRERRTEYIKQLEATIKHHEDQLQSLQQSHRSAADECLMLRYKNSLLERILLEKGIDVQAELKVKTESPHFIAHPSSSVSGQQTSAVQRAVMNRQGQPRRSLSGTAIKPLRPHQTSAQPPPPRLQPTPPSNNMSPTSAPSPLGSAKTIPRSNSGDPKSQKFRQQNTKGPSSKQNMTQGLSSMQNMSPNTASEGQSGGIGTAVTQGGFYPSPFQAHIEQLEQEYDAQANLLEDENPSDQSLGPGPYQQQYQHSALQAGQQMSMGMQGQPSIPLHSLHPMHQTPNNHGMDQNNATYGVVNPGFDPYDPSLDADPFGLTASMHFPTQFTFQESSMRR